MTEKEPTLRPSPAHSITISGFIDENQVASVLPKIEELRFNGSHTITVYINSPGGKIKIAEQVLNLLHSKDINGSICDIITVVLGEAISAAAIFLTLGNYSLAYPHSEIHFHGIRYEEVLDVDSEMASSLVDLLRQRTREISNSMAESVIKRLIHRYSILSSEFERIRQEMPFRAEHNLECFEQCLKREKLSESVAELVKGTVKRTLKALALYETIFQNTSKKPDGFQRDISILRKIFKAKIKTSHTEDWRLDEKGLSDLTSDYFLLRDYLQGHDIEALNWVVDTFGSAFLTGEEAQHHHGPDKKDQVKQIVTPRILPFWYFTVCLCRNLLSGENRLIAHDAYWLGIVDEVIGTSQTGYRSILEQKATPLKVGEQSNPDQQDFDWMASLPRSNPPHPHGISET